MKETTCFLARRDLLKLVPQGVALSALTAVFPQISSATAIEAQGKAAGSVSAPTTLWQADWIWEPIENLFLRLPPRIHVGGPPFKNLFTYFRRRVDLAAKPIQASLRIAADSRYKLYINGQYIGRGPARCTPVWQSYDEYDLTRHLSPGENVLGVLHYFYGEDTGWYVLGRPGLIAECELGLANGDKVLVKTDERWRYKRAMAFARDTPRKSGALGFIEIYDARHVEADWTSPGFDDSKWEAASIITRDSSSTDMPAVLPPYPWENLVARDIPMLLETEVLPAKVVGISEVENVPVTSKLPPALQMTQETPHQLNQCEVNDADSLTATSGARATIRTSRWGETCAAGDSAVLVLDFGREITGYPRIELDGVSGGVIDIGVSESMTAGRVTPARNGLHANRYIMKDGPQSWEAFEWDGFRYMQITVRNCPSQVALRKVAVNFTSYPVEHRAWFECSNSKLNQIWQMCRHTLQLCMHDAYEDCPNREQRQWVGDAYVETKVNYSLFGDTRLATRMVRQIAQSQRSDGIIGMFAPGASDSGPSQLNIKDFVLHWVGCACELYRYTGDAAVLRDLYPAILDAVHWFTKRIGPSGLLTAIPPWIFYDWAPVDKRGESTVLNALFYSVLTHVSEAAGIVGDHGSKERFGRLALQVRAAIQQHLWDERRGVYVDARENGLQSRRVSQHANALCLLYDIADDRQRGRIISYVFSEDRVKCWEGPSMPALITLPPGTITAKEQTFNEESDVVAAQPFFMHWVNAALAHVGAHELMMKLIEIGWGDMLRGGATTAWETWKADASECHGWSTTPAHDLIAYILGVRQVQPGFAEFAVEPHPVNLQWARGTRPSPQGEISVSWESGRGHFHIAGSRPGESIASVLIPLRDGRAPREITVGRQVVWQNGLGSGAFRVKRGPDGVRVQIKHVAHYDMDAKY